MKHIQHSQIIQQIGGTVEMARICEVSSQAVSKWKRTGIPKARLMFLKEKYPNLFSNQKEAA